MKTYARRLHDLFSSFRPMNSKPMPDARFYRTLLTIAIPIALQDLLLSALNLVDTVMIGRLGKWELAAVSLCNQFYFIILLFFFGLGSGASVLMSQYWGKRNVVGIRKTLGITLLIGIVGAVPITLLTLGYPESIIRIFSPDPQVIAHGANYLGVVGLSYLFTGITIAYSMGMRSVGNTRLPFYASAISLILNVALNWILIFGNLGFPALGVRGAAIATVIARVIESLVIVVGVYLHNSPPAVRMGDLRSVDRFFVRKFASVVLPVVVHEVIFAIGLSTHKAAFARMGTDVLAANAIVDPAFRLAFVLLISSANAGAVMIGNRIGAGELERAQKWANRFLLLGTGIGIVVGVALALSAGPITLLYNVSTEVRQLGRNTLRTFLVLMPLKGLFLHTAIAILRAGGDNRYNMMIDLGMTYFVGIPLVFLSGLLWNFSLPVVYLMVGIADLGALTLGVLRTRSGRWIHEVTVDQ